MGESSFGEGGSPSGSGRPPHDGWCPVTHTRGTGVHRRTVKAALTGMALARLSRLDHFFCHEQACPVVYFDAAGTRYDRSDLRVPVWQKEAPGDRVICYCFGDTEGDVRREIVLTGQCHAAARIRAHIAADRCACDIRNPKGVCCLGDLLEVIRRLGAPGTART